MPKPKVLALVMAGGEGSRLELLTERRAKPAVPFAGVFRLIEGSARLDRALLSPGTTVCGEVTRSVLGPGVVVEPGASVRDAVLLDDCVVAAGARVERAVLDRGVRVGREARVGGAGDDGEPAL